MKSVIFTKVFTDQNIETAIRVAADIGYDGIEIMGRDPHLPPDTSQERALEIKSLLTEFDLFVPCLATYTGGYSSLSNDECEAELEVFEKFLELSTILEIDLLRHSAGGPGEKAATDTDYERAATWLRRAADLAAEYNRYIGLEIHSHSLTETANSTLRLLEMIDRANVGIIHDASEMFIADDFYGSTSVEKLNDHTTHVHIKDLSRVSERSLPDVFQLHTQRGDELFRRELLGQGHIDYGQVVNALVENEYDGFVTTGTFLEQRDPYAVAQHEYKMLRALIDQANQ